LLLLVLTGSGVSRVCMVMCRYEFAASIGERKAAVLLVVLLYSLFFLPVGAFLASPDLSSRRECR
jgi:hypothetical protein